MAQFNGIIQFIENPRDIPRDQRKSPYDFVSAGLEPPCDMSTTLSNTLSDPYLAFSYYSLEERSPSDPFLLFNPCGPNSDGDCNQIDMKECGNTSVLFASWRTLWDCLTLASLTLAARRWPDAFSEGTQSSVINDALEPLGMDTDSLGDFDAIRVFNLTYECARASCEEWLMDGSCSVGYPQGSNFSLTDDGRDVGDEVAWGPVMSEALGRVCDDLPTLNVDIAGPGVSDFLLSVSSKLTIDQVIISYMIQAIFVIAFTLILRLIFVGSTIDFFAAPCLAIKRVTSKTRNSMAPFTQRHPRLVRYLQYVQDNNLIHSTMTLLVDFQEAQCFFVMGVQVAVLVATSQRADFHGTFTIFSLRETRQASRDLAHMGTMAICMMQITLRRLNIASAYTMVLSLSTLLLATVAREVGFDMKNMETTMSSINEIMPVKQCGDMGSMRLQCLGQTRFVGIDTGFLVVGQQAVYGVAFFLLVCIQLWKDLSHHKTLVRMLPPSLTKFSRSRGIRTAVTTLTTMILGGSELFLGLSLCTNMTFLFNYIGQTEDTLIVYDNRVLAPGSKPLWNIGQVLAVLVWAPVLFKFLYVLLRK